MRTRIEPSAAHAKFLPFLIEPIAMFSRLSQSTLVLCCAASLLLLGCSPKEPAVQSAPDPVLSVQATSVLMDAPHLYETTGSVKAQESVQITSRIPAYIRSLPVPEGTAVKKGTVLAQLDPTDVDAAITQAQAAVAAARADLQDAQTDYRKFSDLYKQESVSDNELRKTRLRLESAQAKEAAAQAQLASARAQRSYSTITAPMDGWISQKIKHAGDMVLPGFPILLFDSAAAPRFETALPEDIAPRIRPGSAVTVRIDGEENQRTGHVELVVPSADPITRTHLTKIVFAGDTTPLVPGRFGRAFFSLGGKGIPAVDSRAVVRRGGLDGVFVIDGDRARFQWLRLGAKANGYTEVLSGLTGKEKIVLNPTLALTDNERIDVAGAQ